MKPKIAIIALPHSRSSAVMEAFDKAGYELGDVTRQVVEGYPAGRLELWPLARATTGKSKTIPLPKDTDVGDLSNVQVAKCLPAWIPVLKHHGFNYWVSMCRKGTVCDATQYPHDEVLDASQPLNPVEIWERAEKKLGEIHGGKTKRRGRRADSRKDSAEDNNGTGNPGQGQDADRGTDSCTATRGRGGNTTEAREIYAAGSGFTPHWGPDRNN